MTIMNCVHNATESVQWIICTAFTHFHMKPMEEINTITTK